MTDVVRFVCINGHRLSAARDQVGKTGKCPYCGSVFRIPAPDGIDGLEDELGAPAAVAPPESAKKSPPAPEPSPFVSASPAGPAMPELPVQRAPAPTPSVSASANVGTSEQIEFLCPNGHALRGPVSLAGKPGRCPHCGVKFVVPSADDFAAHEAEEASLEFTSAGGVMAAPSSEQATEHPLAALYQKLAAYRPAGGKIEIHLEGGESFTPDGFAPELSHGAHAVFSRKDYEGVTLTAVAWSSIIRIDVKGAKDLPEGLIEAFD